MKKVSKFALVLITVISFLFFLFYKTRYDKLYNVLEVLEFFGDENSAAGLKGSGSKDIFHPPSWQRVTDNIYVYSAFCTRQPGSSDVCPTVSILAISRISSSPGSSNNDLGKLTCQLWYDSSIQPISVPFIAAPPEIQPKDDNEQQHQRQVWQPQVLHCESKFASVLPFGVSFGHPGDHLFKPFLHITSPPLPSIESHNKSGEILACLKPQKNQIDSTFMAVENVLMHNFFGIKDFHVYDNGLTNKFTQTMSSDKLPILTNVNLVPWNVPAALSQEITDYLVRSDCEYRAQAMGYSTVIVLSLSQILVPRSGATSIKTALKQTLKKGKLSIHVLRFCSEYPEENPRYLEHNIVSLRQSIYNTDLSSGLYEEIWYKGQGSSGGALGAFKVSQDELAVHDYGNCDNYDLDVKGPESVRDRTISRQAKEIETKYGQFFPPLPSE